jgi:hypothetical protein
MAKYGPAPLEEGERRLSISLSLSNKNYPRLRRFRAAAECKEGGTLTNEQLIELAQTLAYAAIDAYCETVERDNEVMIL